MADLEYTVTNQGIATTKTSRLVSGTIGVYTVKFTFNNVWNGLEKWATFAPIPGTPYKQPLDANGECTIPGEVMGGVYLRIGVFGLADGQAYPTIWASKLPLEEGCFVNVPPSDWPEPSPLLEDVVKVSEQTFTDAQKAQARTNIGAAGSADMATALAGKVDKPEDATPGNVAVIGSNSNIEDGGHKFSDAFPVGSASGSIVTIEDGADGVPIKSMTVDIQPVQAGSGDPSPSNIRPISGATKAIVHQTGKNLLDALHDDSLTSSGYSNYTINQGVVTVTGNTLFGFVVPVCAGVSYNFSFLKGDTSNNINLRVREYSEKPSSMNDASYIAMPVNNGFSSSARCQVTYTPSAMTRWVWFGFFRNGVPSGNSMTISEFQIEVGTSFTEYTPFVSRNTYEIEFPTEAGTVYGGQLQVAEDGSGTLTVDAVKHEFTGDETVGKYSSYFYVPIAKTAYGVNHDSNAMCSHFPYAYITTASPGVGFDVANSSRNNKFSLFINGYDNQGLNTIAHINEFLADQYENGTPVTVVFHLSDPVTYQLTAPQVSSLLGINNIWSDTGDIAVEYHADPTIFVEKKTKAIKQSIAPVEDGYTASQAYISGRLFYVQDQLYQATTAISSGATITPGTNCRAVTVADIIFYILDDLQ